MITVAILGVLMFCADHTALFNILVYHMMHLAI